MPGKRAAVGRLSHLRTVTADEVLAELKAAWIEEPAYPDAWWCGHVAMAVNTWVERKKNGKPSEETVKKSDKNYLAMRKHARAFLRIAPEVIADLQSRRLILSRPPGTENIPPEIWREIAPVDDLAPGLTKAVAAIETTKAAVEAILEHDPPREWKSREPVLFIGEMVKHAWRCTGVKVNLKLNDGSPLVAFVQRIMELAGCHQAESTASDKLRKRQNRPRKRTTNSAKSKSKSAKKRKGGKPFQNLPFAAGMMVLADF